MGPPRAVLLDVGDTILRQRWFDLSIGIDAVVHERTRSTELASAFQAYELAAYARGDVCLLSEWLRAQVPSLNELSIEVIEDQIWRTVVHMDPLPGVGQALDRLAEDCLPVGAVSNAAFSGRAICAELARHGLAAKLQFVLSSADIRVRKPSLGIYSAALDRLGAPASETWFVGDTFSEDIVGALAAGLQPVWITAAHSVHASAADVPVVGSWGEFLTLYESQSAR